MSATPGITPASADNVDRVYSGADYIKQLQAEPKAEKLTAGFSENGLASSNYDEIKAAREKNKLFTDKNKLGKQDFLLLLTTQLKFQDPMEPMKNEDFIAQMAQFSSLENMTNIETAIMGMDDSFHKSLTLQTESSDALKNSADAIAGSLSANNTTQLAMNNALTSGLIGKDIRVKVDSVLMNSGNNGEIAPKRFFYSTDTPANDVKINIYDAENKLVRTLSAESLQAHTPYDFEPYGDHSVVWDGKDNSGEMINPGLYSVKIEAKLGSGAVPAQLFEQGTVGGIDYRSEGVLLQVKSRDWDWAEDDTVKYYTTSIPIGSILSVREHTELAQD